MGRRVIRITLAASFCLLTARAASAGAIDFQSAVASGGGQSGGAQTSQSGSSTTPSQVQTVDLGDVTGTVCDCGEISPSPKGGTPAAATHTGGFPKFPLLALASASPAICAIPGFCTSSPPKPPKPPNPPVPEPEPLTLVTFAAGLAALYGLRRRRV